jgi:hypothetical protein
MTDGQSVLVSGSHLKPMAIFLLCVWRMRVSWCGAPSLSRGWVCNLLVQLLLGLSRAVTLGVEVSQNSRPYFTVSFETPPTWRDRPPYLYPPGTGWPSYTPAHWVSFFSPLRVPSNSSAFRLLNYIWFSSYLTGNTSRLHCRDQPVEAVQGRKRRLLSQSLN